MRTLLSHDDTPKKSAFGEKAISEMLSEGGCGTSTSLEMSPWVVDAEAEEPNKAAMVNRLETGGEQSERRIRRCWPQALQNGGGESRSLQVFRRGGRTLVTCISLV
jgi:hypothetical protein